MAEDDSYMLSRAETDIESARLRSLQQASDPFTIQHLEATGVGEGWRCLEVGAGGGSIAGWLGERVGAAGSVVATDIDLQRLGGLPETVDVRPSHSASLGMKDPPSSSASTACACSPSGPGVKPHEKPNQNSRHPSWLNARNP